ncbi:MAG: hypothetical protein ACK5Y2_12490 [Bdellovibrionales bacterium]
MLIPLQAPEIWDHLNEKYRELLGLKTENPVRCYTNLYSAVDELTHQLTEFLAHKRALTWIKGFSPTFEAPLASFLRDGLQVQAVDWKILSQFQGQEASWVESLPKDTLFVLAFDDHAVTGEKIDLDGFDKALNQKKIFFIRVSHFALRKSHQEIQPFTIYVGPAGSGDLALAICGSRFRAPERAVPYFPWKLQPAPTSTKGAEPDQELVLKIESEFPEERWFSGKETRHFDRLVFCFPDLTGDRVLDRLSKKLGIVFDSNQAQTTHNCQWNSIRLFKSWWTPQPRPEQLRGLVLISLEIARRPDFTKILKDTVAELRKETDWV